MGKKKDKTFSYNNTHGHGVYPSVYPVGQRYPHTDFHHNDPFWIYEELGILKDWIISLTKLGGMLAQTENDDVENLVCEIAELINVLDNCLEGVYKSLHGLYDKECDFDKELLNYSTTIFSLCENIETFIHNLLPPFYTLFDCIESHLKAIDYYSYNNINELKDDVENIYTYLENQLNENYITLKEGTDYEIVFFNGFHYNNEYYGEQQSVQVQLAFTELLTKHFYKFYIHCGHSYATNHAITNDYIYTSNSSGEDCPIFGHGNGWRNTPNSWIFMIRFLGEYNYLNYLSVTSTEQGSSNNLFNMTPISARASFPINIGLTIGNVYSNDGKYSEGNGLILAMSSINDGINTQYYDYINLGLCDELGFGNTLNIDMILNATD